LTFGSGDPVLEEKLAAARQSMGTDPDGARDPELVAEANALSNEILERKGTLAVPSGLRLRREAPAPHGGDTPVVVSFEGEQEESHLLLRWVVEGDAAGFMVERIGKDGQAVLRETRAADARSYRDGPVDSVVGTQRYRLKALAPDGSVAAESETEVSFRVQLELTFVGLAPDGRGRFRAVWSRAGRVLPEEFPAGAGERIGAAVPGRDGLPDLDWRSDTRFVGPRWRREPEERPVGVPRFGPDGSLERHPETNEVVLSERTVTIFRLLSGALVIDPEGRHVWLQKAKD
jgi:hypothetical protein